MNWLINGFYQYKGGPLTPFVITSQVPPDEWLAESLEMDGNYKYAITYTTAIGKDLASKFDELTT